MLLTTPYKKDMKDITFDVIMEWAPDNREVFDELLASIKRGSVIPFVGAGLSAPVYPLWKDVLKELTNKLSSEEKREEVNCILNDLSKPDSYTRAADKLIKYRSEINVFANLLEIFNENKIKDSVLRTMTVFLLPCLFQNTPVITTNYDRVLEHVFQMHNLKLDNIYSPDSDLAAMVEQRGLHCLFKIHGDIGAEAFDWRKLILSGESYNKVYKADSELVGTLKKFYEGKMMLFMGSSLKYDRTLDILKQVTDTGMISHYAILPCKKDDIDDDSLYFGNSGIRAIFYDPNHHESVKLILEELLRRKS